MRVLILPNLPTYGALLKDGMAEENPRRPEAEKVLAVLFGVLGTLREGRTALANGHNGVVAEDLRGRLNGKVGEFLAAKISEAGEVDTVHAILEV